MIERILTEEEKIRCIELFNIRNSTWDHHKWDYTEWEELTDEIRHEFNIPYTQYFDTSFLVNR